MQKQNTSKLITTPNELVTYMKKDFTLGESYIFYLLINNKIDETESLIEQSTNLLAKESLMDFLMKESSEGLELVNCIILEVFQADLDKLNSYYTFYKLFVEKNMTLRLG